MTFKQKFPTWFKAWLVVYGILGRVVNAQMENDTNGEMYVFNIIWIRFC